LSRSLGKIAGDIVTADIGGTNARFALAELVPGERPRLGDVRRYRTADHPGLASAWRAFARDVGEPLPAAAAIAVAAPIDGDILRFLNSPWTIDRRRLLGQLGVERLTLLNDFGAIAYAVSVLAPDELAYLAGPEGPLPAGGVTTVLGPGTGLGVAMLLRRGGRVEVVETEGSHIGFAPLNEEEQRIAEDLRRRYGRASVERIVSGPGLYDLYRACGGAAFEVGDAAALWGAALDGKDPVAEQALDHLVKAFGSAAGDLALAHGANAVAVSSALSLRMADRLRSPLFAGRFIAKGRYRERMQGIRIRLVTHEEPGLLGAAVAFEREWGP
jgi:glucokinase